MVFINKNLLQKGCALHIYTILLTYMYLCSPVDSAKVKDISYYSCVPLLLFYKVLQVFVYNFGELNFILAYNKQHILYQLKFSFKIKNNKFIKFQF